ncbi:hypothetical protein ACQJBY_020882 [Aegilops geniculata]
MAPCSAPIPAWSSSSPTSSTTSRPRPAPASPPPTSPRFSRSCLPTPSPRSGSPSPRFPSYAHADRLAIFPARGITSNQYAASHISSPLVKIRQLTLACVLFDEMPQSGVRLDEYVYAAGIRDYSEAGNLTARRSSWRGLGVKVSVVSYVLLYGLCKNQHIQEAAEPPR